MPARDPAAVGRKWSQNLAGSTEQIRAGVQAVQTAPGTLAARQADVWQNNTIAAKGKYIRGVQSVSLADWQQATIGKGLQRIASGAQASEPKFVAAMTRLLPYIEQGVRGLPPRGNLEQNKQRALAMITHMANYNRGGAA